MIFKINSLRRSSWSLVGLTLLALHGCGGGSSGSLTPQAPATAPTSWSISCFDNQCIDITDQRLTAGQSFSVSTASAGGSALATYTVTASSSNTIVFRPTSYAELALLDQSTGLSVSITPQSPAGSSPIISFVAYKVVTSFSHGLSSGQLTMNLNGNSAVQSSSYSIDFLDTNQNLLQTLSGVTPTASSLIVDSTSLQSAVVAAYDGNGIFVRIANSQDQALPGAYYTNASDIGALNDFYDATQLQGQFALTDQGLVNVQSNLGYLASPNVDVPYMSRFASEIPFAHTFSITRFLGGYTPTDVEEFCSSTAGTTTFASYCKPTAYPWSLDYVIASASSTTYQTALMLDRVSPYINAGYSPSDMTLVLINVPWTISSDIAPQNGSMCVSQSTGGSLGVWGQCNPPASYTQWATVISHLASDLASNFPSTAANFNFEIGDEYDQSSTFNGQPDDFYNLYEYAYGAVRSVFDNAVVTAGDFTQPCFNHAVTNNSGCVYDSKAFLSREISRDTAPPYVARSLNMFWDTSPSPYPSAAVSAATASFAYVTSAASSPLPLEIHQFGFLHMPWGDVGALGGASVGSLQANWDLQALMGLKKALPSLARVFNWGGVVTTDSSSFSFLEGAGYIRTILDNHQGAELYMLPVTTGNLPPGNEVMAVALVEGDNFQIIVSNVDVVAPSANLASLQPDPPTPVTVTIPTAWLGSTNWNYLRYSPSVVDNVYAQIKADFANAQPQSILDPKFAQCAICFSDPFAMATDLTAAQSILTNNWTSSSNYVQTMQNTLKWNSVTSVNSSNQLNIDQNGITHAFSQIGGTLNVTLGANEMLVLNPN